MPFRLTVLPLTALLVVLVAGCSSGPVEHERVADPSSSAAATTGCEYPADAAGVREVSAPDAASAVSGPVDATLQTSAGDIAITLDADRTPCTVTSFVSLAEQGYFTDSPCHRVTTQGIFVLQCGDPSGTGRGGPGYRYADELDGSETYPAGTVAMANAGPDTNGSQFFLVFEDSPLPPAYTVFGQLTPEGLEVVRTIGAGGAEGGAADGAPATPVEITGVVRG